MIRHVIVASLLIGCRLSLENEDATGDDGSGRRCAVSTTSPSCLDAVTHADLAWIQMNIFSASCTFSGCHNGTNNPAGKIDLRPNMSHGHLVNFTSLLDPSRKLVVPNDVEASYLMLMLGDVPPAMASPPAAAPPGSVGYMPQGAGGRLSCCQKLDALERWIMTGAPNN
jgi:hypothetical protein